MGASLEASDREVFLPIGLGSAGSVAGPLPTWLSLLHTAARTAKDVATALLLPQLTYVAPTASILCARNAGPEASSCTRDLLRQLVRGERVRILPNEGIYEFDGLAEGGYWLRLLNARSHVSSGRFWVPDREALRIEPTRRKRPIGRANRHEWPPLGPTPWDLFAKADLAGNAALARLRVVLVGSRSEFAATLNALGFAGKPGEMAMHVAEGLPWGIVTDDGELELIRPHAASGQPVIAIARDHSSAKRLASRFAPRTLIIVSDRYEDALGDRTSVEALAERHSCLVLAPSRLREEFLHRRNDGWVVAELSYLSPLRDERIGIRELDRIAASSAWMRKAPVIETEESPELDRAFRHLVAFSRAATPHLDIDDDVNEAARLLRQNFFEVCDWLGAPAKEELEDLKVDCEAVAALVSRLRSVVGSQAADDVREVLSALNCFAEKARHCAMTPKGERLARIAEATSMNPLYRHVVVTALRSSAIAAGAFLQQLGTPLDCVTPIELQSMDDVGVAIALSMVRREPFMRLVDPWAAPELLLLGYQHEVEIYRRRLATRHQLISRLQPDAALVARLPQLAENALTELESGSTTPPKVEEPLIGAKIPALRPQPSRIGEQTKPARFCRFAGRSWMAMTDDHAVARVHISSGHKAQVGTVHCRDLQVGDLILIREGGEKDIVREVAEGLAGQERYAELRQQAGYWRRAIGKYRSAPERLQESLAEEGLERGLATIRSWVSPEGPIGPNKPDTSLPLIAAAIGQSAEDKPWKLCLNAIHEIRGYHVHAGFRLTKVLMDECGEAIRDHSEHETAFDLSVGIVWLLEIEQLEVERQEWPYTQTNKIQWESDTWRKRLLRRVVKPPTPTLNDLFPDVDETFEEFEL